MAGQHSPGGCDAMEVLQVSWMVLPARTYRWSEPSISVAASRGGRGRGRGMHGGHSEEWTTL